MRGIAIGLLVVASAWTISGLGGGVLAQEKETAPERPVSSDASTVPADLSDLVERIREKHDVPALGAAMVVGDCLTAVGVSGLRAKGAKERVTVDDLWHLGSCTKTMTATLIARLVERDELAWDTTIESAFPKLTKIDPAFRPVTLELLLGNRGGAPAQLLEDGLWLRLQQRKGTHRAQRLVLLDGVLTKPPVNEPGTEFVYSNAGFAIAGAAAEAQQNVAWEDLLRREVFVPLGMDSGGFGAPGSKQTVDQPRGHMANGLVVAPGPFGDNPPAIGPAATVHCTIRDWAKFVSAHLVGATTASDEKSYLQRATFERLQRPLEGQDYALGWQTLERPWGGGRVLSHSGSNTYWYCTTWVAPARGFAVLVTCNQGGPVASAACDELVGALIRRQLAPAPEPR